MDVVQSLVSFVGWWVVIGLVVLGVIVGTASLRFWWIRRQRRAEIARRLDQHMRGQTLTKEDR